MDDKSLEARGIELENQVAELKARSGTNWIADITGICKDDPDFDEIVRLGKEARDAEGITVDAQVCHGQPCVAGTRVPVSVVLDNLAAGVSTEEILKSYPSLTAEGIPACLRYASEAIRPRHP